MGHQTHPHEALSQSLELDAATMADGAASMTLALHHAGDTPSAQTYAGMQAAYDYFNRVLFADKLVPCLLTLQRKRSTRGYFWGDIFTAREESAGEAGARTHELALNPDLFAVETTRDVLSTLVHEMCHVEEFMDGTQGKGGYHNRQWGALMKRVGLHPTTTGGVDGGETGTRVTHFIIEGGAFDKACDYLLSESGFEIQWASRATSEQDKRKAKRKAKSKTKYTCPSCGAGAWAKPESSLICGECVDAFHERAPSEFKMVEAY